MLEEEKENLQSDEQEEDLSEDEETDEEDGEDDQEGENDGEEPDVEALKAENEKLRQERDNYKTGLLSQKARSRPLPFSGDLHKPKEQDQPKEKPAAQSKPDEIEIAVQNVIGREAERQAMRSVLDHESSNYIAELEDSDDYMDIIQYLPKNANRTSEAGIVRALRVAVSAWKFDRGFADKKKEKKKENKTFGTETFSTLSGAPQRTQRKKGERKFLKKQAPPSEWYG